MWRKSDDDTKNDPTKVLRAKQLGLIMLDLKAPFILCREQDDRMKYRALRRERAALRRGKGGKARCLHEVRADLETMHRKARDPPQDTPYSPRYGYAEIRDLRVAVTLTISADAQSLSDSENVEISIVDRDFDAALAIARRDTEKRELDFRNGPSSRFDKFLRPI